MKKFLAMLLAFCMLGTTAYGAEQGVPDAAKTAIPSQQVVIWDGKETTMQCYNIDGYNYFRLRDVAETVTDRIDAQMHHFDILYHDTEKSIDILRGTDYKPFMGTDEYSIGTEKARAIPANTQFMINGTRIQPGSVDGYVIDGYTFYRLRDIVDCLLLKISWCEEEKEIEIIGKRPSPPPQPVFDEDGNPIYAARKPVIYLYPEETTDVSVKVNCDLTVIYPAYGEGWRVTAQPNGTLTNHADGKEYSYLFWEGEGYGKMDFSEGFCVKGEDTAAFLQETLAQMGLTPKEYNEFIVYWLPYMQENPYNLISFQWENYDEAAKLEINPAPDNLLRVFMAFQALDAPVEIPEQKLPILQREGFTVVEWGGTEM